MNLSTKCALAVLLCAGFLNAQSTPPQISKEFRKASLLSVEAEKRLDDSGLDVMIASGPVSSESDRKEKESEYAAIKLDTSKQLTEAKIEAESPDEKIVYALLNAGYEMTLTGAATVWSFDIKLHARKAAARCRMEVLTIVDPDEVDENLRKLASDTGCLAAREAVNKETLAVVLAERKAVESK